MKEKMYCNDKITANHPLISLMIFFTIKLVIAIIIIISILSDITTVTAVAASRTFTFNDKKISKELRTRE
jgi:hypothetical protein